jgi:hypothetical protein
MVSESTMSTKRSVLAVGAYGVTTTPGTRFIMNSAATVAFGFPTSLGLRVQKDLRLRHSSRTREYATHLNKNCLFRLLMSMVSISITWMSLNPDKARFARISHPKPPAPITKVLHWFLRNILTLIMNALASIGWRGEVYCTSSPARNEGSVRGPGLSRIWSTW